MRNIKITDTTLRDGEQTPGVRFGVGQKLDIALRLERLGVDCIEAGFPASSPGDAEAVAKIASAVQKSTVCALARCVPGDIDAAAESLRTAAHPRIHVFIATSDIHLAHKLHCTRDEVLARIRACVSQAVSLCPEVQFSPEDATRTDPEFLLLALRTAAEAGARIINIPDTVGYTTPAEFGALISRIHSEIPDRRIGVHCHNDLGLAVANSLAAIEAGASSVECTVNGLGERAGNAALEEVVMALSVRRDVLGAVTGLDTREITDISRLVSSLSGIPVSPNKAIVGANVFTHESGIHQHGVMANVKTYEIMTPESVGVKKTELVLGKHSGQHAFAQRLVQLGYTVDKALESKLFADFKVLADRKKTIEDRDIVALVEVATGHVAGEDDWKLKNYVVSSGNRMYSTACVTLEKGRKEVTESAYGTGPVFASIRAVEKIVRHAFSLLDYQINAATEGRDALGEVKVKISDASGVYRGRGVSTDIIEGSVLATLDAVNRMLDAKTTSLGSGAASKVQQTFENPEADMLAGHTDR